MSKKLTCFVIIGYGTKVSYANNKVRSLDLDETFTLLIKPVFDELGIDCYRAIDKNVSGSIDTLMLKEIMYADIAVVDLSTLNANVMWELGVRHALRPRHTIMICEKGQMNAIPFDVNHFIIHQYTHSEEGIPHREVNRFQGHLKQKVNEILALPDDFTDSPVHTYLKDEFRKAGLSDIILAREATPSLSSSRSAHSGPKEFSFNDLIQEAEAAKKQSDFEKALQLLSVARKFATEGLVFRDSLPFIISRQALCTYKSKQPNEKAALLKAREILSELEPDSTDDVEVLGLSGAIHKRLFELGQNRADLDASIRYYERGFTQKRDYYNGINAAFMLYNKVSLLKAAGEDWEETKTHADFIRNSTLKIAIESEASPGFEAKDDALWVLLTIAEAYNYRGDETKMRVYEQKAAQMAAERKDLFAMASYETQKQKIKAL